MELEGIQRVGRDLIVRRSPDVEDFPLALLAETCDGETVVCFDDLLPAEVYYQLSKSGGGPFEMQAAMRILESVGIPWTVNRFRTYVCPDAPGSGNTTGVTCFSHHDPKVAAFGFDGLADSVYGIERDGRIISACLSSRQNSKAGEAWVFTHPDHRRKGLAQQVVLAWAASLRKEGIIPFYSHAMENTNSALLAKKLNLTYVFEETVIERLSQGPISRKHNLSYDGGCGESSSGIP